MYADDIVLLNSFQLLESTSAVMFSLVADWASINTLHLSSSKSSFHYLSPILLHYCLIFLPLTFFSIYPIPRSSSIKILGVHLDSSWSFCDHVVTKCRIAFLRFHFLYPFCHILSISQKLLILQMLVIFLFDYANTVYIPALSQKMLNCVQRVQNSCLRFSYNVHKYDHISPLFLRSAENTSVSFSTCVTSFLSPLYLLRSGILLYLSNLLHFNSDFYTRDTPVIRHHDFVSFIVLSNLKQLFPIPPPNLQHTIIFHSFFCLLAFFSSRRRQIYIDKQSITQFLSKLCLQSITQFLSKLCLRISSHHY